MQGFQRVGEQKKEKFVSSYNECAEELLDLSENSLIQFDLEDGTKVTIDLKRIRTLKKRHERQMKKSMNQSNESDKKQEVKPV